MIGQACQARKLTVNENALRLPARLTVKSQRVENAFLFCRSFRYPFPVQLRPSITVKLGRVIGDKFVIEK